MSSIMLMGIQIAGAAGGGGILELSRRIAEISPEGKTEGLGLPASDPTDAEAKSEVTRQNLRKYRTYELKSLPDSYLRPLALSTNSIGNSPTISPSNAARYDITWSIKLPMFEWLNSQNIGGTPQTPATSPCAMANNEYPSRPPLPNWLNLYSVDLPLPGQSTTEDRIDGIPFPFNGMGCLMGYEAGRNILVNNPGLDTITDGAFDNSAGSELIAGKSELNIAHAFSNILGKVDLDALIDSQKIYRDTEPDRFTGIAGINSLYIGDETTTPEFLVADDLELKALHGQTSPQSIQIPYLLEALKSAFKIQHTLRTQTYGVNTKFIQRNNIGLQLEITRKIYDRETRGSGLFANLQPITVSFEDPQITAELNQSLPSQSPTAYISFRQPTHSQTATITYPWLGQIREIMRRFSLVESGQIETNINRIRQNRRDYLDPIIEAIENTSLSTPAVGISAGGRFDINRLIRGNGNSNPFSGSDLYSKLVATVRNDLILYTCQDLDALAIRLENLPSRLGVNDGSDMNARKSTLAQIIRQTDCWDSVGDVRNPLQEYLCAQGLEQVFCAGYLTGAGLGEICTPFDSSAVPSLEGGDNRSAEQDSLSPGIDEAPTALSAVRPTEARGRITNRISQKHPAIDWGVPIGTVVRSISDCSVVYAGRTTTSSQNDYYLWFNTANPNAPRKAPDGSTSDLYQGFGNTIMLECPVNGGNNNNSFNCQYSPGKRCIAAVYAHLNGFAQGISPGARVGIGKPIGTSGDTGNSLGPHLHFELRKKLSANTFASFVRSGESNRTVYGFQNPNNPDSDPNYIDPTCLFSGECKLSLAGAGFIPGAGGLPGGGFGNQVCAEPAPATTVIPVVRNATPADLSQLRELVNKNCGNDSATCGYLREGLNGQYAEILGVIQANTSDPGGRRNAGGSQPALEIIKSVAAALKMPSEKVAAHLHIESFGANQPLASITRRFNGNYDQVLMSKPNGYGCLGPGQFCPGTIQAYFHPKGTSYTRVLDCVQKLGFIYQYGDVIDPTYVGTAICATASKLNHDKIARFQDADWQQGCCDPSGAFTPESCPHYHAARRYFGGTSGIYGKAADETSNVCRQDSLINTYKQALQI